MASKRLKPKKVTAAPTDTFILLDRSASMASQWLEATSSINAYVRGLAERGVPGHVTLVIFDEFDGRLQYNVVRRHPVNDWVEFGAHEYAPRGNTPLYDAVARTVNLAETTMPARAVIVIMTDGYENASAATTNSMAREMLDRCRNREWQVVFLGANFDTFSQGASLGSARHTMINAVPQAYTATMDMLSAQSLNYAVGGGMRGMSATGNVTFSDANRQTASGVADSDMTKSFTTTNRPPKPKSKAA